MNDILKFPSTQKAIQGVKNASDLDAKAHKYCCNHEIEINHPVKWAYADGHIEGEKVGAKAALEKLLLQAENTCVRGNVELELLKYLAKEILEGK